MSILNYDSFVQSVMVSIEEYDLHPFVFHSLKFVPMAEFGISVYCCGFLLYCSKKFDFDSLSLCLDAISNFDAGFCSCLEYLDFFAESFE